MKFEYFSKYVIINVRSDNMNNIVELSNAIKHDLNKCTQCLKCVNICQNKSLSFDKNNIILKPESCFACKKCIEICDPHALFYNINDGIIEGNNTIAILPYDADLKFIPRCLDPGQHGGSRQCHGYYR